MGGPYYYMGIPVNADGDGPCDEADTVMVVHEVWNQCALSVCQCDTEEMARWVADQLNASPIVAQQQCGWDEASNELFILKHFADEMNERNWRDKRLYIIRHLDRLSAAIGCPSA